jgi:hypothetical protein
MAIASPLFWGVQSWSLLEVYRRVVVTCCWAEDIDNIFFKTVGKCLKKNYTASNIRTLFWHSEDRASCYILTIKTKRCTNFSILFWNITLQVSDRFSVYHQESSTVYTAIGICHTVLDSWWWTENLSEICRVLFQNKMEKLVHLYGFLSIFRSLVMYTQQ